MPSSNIDLIVDAVTIVHEVEHNSILDIGPGHGKHGLLLREYLTVKPQRLDCIEVEPTYLQRFHWLGCIYDHAYQGDGADLPEARLNRYDMVLLYDVIEHIEKQRALDLISRIRGRVAIITPVEFSEQHVEGIPSEDHVSYWTPEDFYGTGRVEVLYQHNDGLVARLGPRPE